MPTPSPILRRGDKGSAVLSLQSRLHDLGYLKAKPDGEFGPLTEQAVLALQNKAGLDMDGVVGPKTWAVLTSQAAPKPTAIIANPHVVGKGNIQDLLVSIAKRDVGNTEGPKNNQGAWIKKFWPATSYPEGYANREPYCAAACCYWLKTLGEELDKTGDLKAITGMTLPQWEKWRCKSAGAWAWQDWAKKAKGVQVLSDKQTPQKGDFVPYDFSHIGLIRQAPIQPGRILTIEANTGPSGERDGDGCWEKDRPQEIARCFIRLTF